MSVVPVLAIGEHIFAALPLSLQTIEEVTRAKWPGRSRFGGTRARQFTGLGDDEFDVTGLYFHQEWGGHDEYLALKATQRAGQPVELMGGAAGGLAATVFGTVVILEVGAKHQGIAGSGIGRRTEFSIKLAPFGDDFGRGLF